jgi:putative membrane protein
MTDLLLAMAHHLLVFGIAALLASEAALLRPGLNPQQLRLLGTLDSLYGIFAVLILIVGFGRVFFGVRGSEFFLTNPWFWAKLAAFAIVGILSAPPTIRFIAWRRHAKTDAGFAITADDVRWVRRFFIAEIVAFAFIPLFAAAMVRVPFL